MAKKKFPAPAMVETLDVGTILLILQFLIKEEPAIAAVIANLFKGRPNGPSDPEWEAAYDHYKKPFPESATKPAKKKARRRKGW